MKVFITDPKMESNKSRMLTRIDSRLILDNLSVIEVNDTMSARSSSIGWLPSINNLAVPTSMNKLDDDNTTLLRGETLELHETTPKDGNISFASGSNNKLPSIDSRPSSRQLNVQVKTSQEILSIKRDTENQSPIPSPDFPGNIKKPPTPNIFNTPIKFNSAKDNSSPFTPLTRTFSAKGKLPREPIKAFESFSLQKTDNSSIPKTINSSKTSRKSPSIHSSNIKKSEKSFNSSKFTFKMSEMQVVESEYIPSSKELDNDTFEIGSSAGESQENTTSNQIKRDTSKDQEDRTLESVEQSSTYKSESYVTDASQQSGNTSRSNSLFKSVAELEYRGTIKKICMLGGGSEARVYLCQIPEFDELVALKQFDLVRNNRNTCTYDSLVREFEMLRHLDHENIIQYYSLYRPKKNHVGNCIEFGFIMEYMAGGSLENYIEENYDNITWEQKIGFLKQILKGLNYLHEHKIIHRDLKPGNILLSNDKAQLKITDFGISVKTNNDSTTKRTLVGTPWYMAPEVINEEPYSSKADIWSVGCCFFHLVTGRKPYHNSNVAKALVLMVSKKSPLEMCDPAAMAKIEEREGVKEFLELCFSREKSERPSAFKLLGHRIFDGIEC